MLLLYIIFEAIWMHKNFISVKYSVYNQADCGFTRKCVVITHMWYNLNKLWMKK